MGRLKLGQDLSVPEPPDLNEMRMIVNNLEDTHPKKKELLAALAEFEKKFEKFLNAKEEEVSHWNTEAERFRYQYERMVEESKNAYEKAERAEEKAEKASLDILTELPQRRLLYEVLKQKHLLSYRPERVAALVEFDLQNFKFVNDILGKEPMGNDVLKRVATELKTRFASRGELLVFRHGGDEFSVIFYHRRGAQQNDL